MIVRVLLVLLVLAPTALAQETREPEREPYRDPVWAATRSALVPGWVQFEYGKENAGTFYMMTTLFAAAVAFGVVDLPLLDQPEFEKSIGVGMWGSVAALSAVDAYETVHRLNVENGYEMDLGRSCSSPPARFRVTIFSSRF